MSEIDYAEEYNNSGRVANAEDIIDQYVLDAAVYREMPGRVNDLDLSYGPEPRNLIDIFWPDESRDAPIVMFIHGGYWQRLDRSAFSHMASGLNANGIAVAVPSYTLCPDVTIDDIITEMRRACILLYQTFEKRLTVIGHSAGGHLAACMMATDWQLIHSDLPDDLVPSGMGISGIYDLVPLIETPINNALGLLEDTATAASPVNWIPTGYYRFEAWVGEDESSEYHRQSRDLSHKWSMLGTPTQYVSEPGKNHFTIIDALTNPQSGMTQCIVGLVKEPTAEAMIAVPSEEDIAAETRRVLGDEDGDVDLESIDDDPLDDGDREMASEDDGEYDDDAHENEAAHLEETQRPVDVGDGEHGSSGSV